jgi:hypothetical protein
VTAVNGRKIVAMMVSWRTNRAGSLRW